MKTKGIIETNLRFPTPLWLAVKKLAAAENLSAQQLVQRTLEQYVKAQKGGAK